MVTSAVSAKVLLRGQLAHLRQAGFDVSVIASPDHPLDVVGKREGVTVSPIPMHREVAPFRDLVSLFRIAAYLRKIRPHIVNASTPKAALLGLLAARLLRVPTRIYNIRGLRLETTRGVKRRLLYWAEKTCVACATDVYAVSESLRRRVAELGIAPLENVRVLGSGSSNGVDTERFHPPESPEDRSRLLARLELPPDSPVIGFVGRFTRDKGFQELTDAFARIRQTIPETRLLLVGEFESGDPVSDKTADALRNDPAVTVTGFVDNPEVYYKVMDVLAFPSYREGFPNTVLEASASAVPVVAFRVTGSVDAVVDGVTGSLVPQGDTQAFTEATQAYLLDETRRRAHGRAGRERVLRCFQREQVWEAWLREYRAVVAKDALTCNVSDGGSI